MYVKEKPVGNRNLRASAMKCFVYFLYWNSCVLDGFVYAKYVHSVFVLNCSRYPPKCDINVMNEDVQFSSTKSLSIIAGFPPNFSI